MRITWSRFIVASTLSARPRALRPDARLDALNVIGVAVVAVPVVHRDDVGAFLAQDRRESLTGSSMGAAMNESGSLFCSHPVMPESR